MPGPSSAIPIPLHFGFQFFWLSRDALWSFWCAVIIFYMPYVDALLLWISTFCIIIKIGINSWLDPNGCQDQDLLYQIPLSFGIQFFWLSRDALRGFWCAVIISYAICFCIAFLNLYIFCIIIKIGIKSWLHPNGCKDQALLYQNLLSFGIQFFW